MINKKNKIVNICFHHLVNIMNGNNFCTLKDISPQNSRRPESDNSLEL